ncbi:MAG: ferritin-like domain-containing protein [Novipirellula sp. JB048]
MSLDSLADAFYDELRDLLSAEKQLTKALPKLVKHASSDPLRQAFETHLAETQEHVKRVESAFEETGKAARAKTCEAMAGLIKEADGLLKENGEPVVKDALLIAAAQKVEHYELATYGTLCTWAEMLGYNKALSLLKQNMADEENTDKKLSELAKTINQQAVGAS